MEKQNQQVLQQRKEHEKEKGDIILNAIKDDDDYDDSWYYIKSQPAR